MKKLVMIVMMFSLIQCKTNRNYYYPPANKSDLIKDSFYYCRDTINFYEVNVSERLAMTLDSIFAQVPIVAQNNYWTVEIVDKSLTSYTMILKQDNCEEFFMDIEYTNSMYQAMNIAGRSVLIMDSYNVFNVAIEKPFIKIKNPRELKAIYQKIGGHSWLFKLDRKGEFISVKFRE